ncbi:protease complex subunit PrcB family protein [bacterium]|nr:protease complex subunit PrcB family protein [bacterium]MCI0605892.1 protease complex subunit PrcB family protein [bacterium]
MKVVLTLALAALVAMFLVVAVNAEEEKKKSDKKEEEEREVIVNYEIIEQGTYSGKKDAVAQVITSQQEWEQLWKQHVSVLVPQPPVPEIDFETHVLAVIFAGEKKSGGYAVVIKDVSIEADDVIVKYRLTEPQPNSFTIQVITQPFAVIKIEKPKGTVRLVKE